MTLEQDLAAFINTRPDWQRVLVRRFCRGEPVRTFDVEALADSLIDGSDPAAEDLEANEIPGAPESSECVILGVLKGVQSVNALAPDQELEFSETGLTIVYGDNASGKSGYARVIREVVAARVKAGLLVDVFNPSDDDPDAELHYSVAGQRRVATLLGDRDPNLQSVRFYDEDCGDAFVTSAAEITYRPSALTLLDRLSKACEILGTEFDHRLEVLRQRHIEPESFGEGTSARTFVESLAAATSRRDIDEATRTDTTHSDRLAEALAEQTRLKTTDPAKEKARLQRLAEQWSTIAAHCDELSENLSEEALGHALKTRDAARDLRHAAGIAAKSDFDAEPIEGVGSAAWRALWQAARQFSEAEAYPSHEFPHVGDESACVLCQQLLGKSAAERLARFEQFVTDTTERDAEAAERALADLSEKYHHLADVPAKVVEAQAQLGEQDRVFDSQGWIEAASTGALAVAAFLDNEVSELPVPLADSPSSDLRLFAQQAVASSEDIDDSTFAEKVSAAGAAVDELQASKALADRKQDVVREVQRLEQRAAIEAAKKLTDTTGVTRKSTELTQEHVTKVVRDHFTRETERLKLRRVTLDPTDGRRGVTLEHRPQLLGAEVDARIDSVLSEGEQTALGLAGFLTEVEFDESKSAVVLDDPVSSLDAGRRSRVAERVLQLAQERQVIVFTHDSAFVAALFKWATDLGVDVTERAVVLLGDQPGGILNSHPWNVKDTGSRIDQLAKDLAELKNDRADLDSEEYAKRARLWADNLSQAWERAVNLEVVDQVVDRGTNRVAPHKFRFLVPISDDDNRDFQAGYGTTSGWCRHDQAPAENFVAPDVDEMEAELKRLQAWVGRIKSYRK